MQLSQPLDDLRVFACYVARLTDVLLEDLDGRIHDILVTSSEFSARDGTYKVLVATDIAARGLDIDRLPHVVNFELPHVPEDYVHRIGRTGRAGSAGTSISFACEEDSFYLLSKTLSPISI